MVPLLPVYFAGLFGLVVSVPIKHYASKYDHINVEMILNNRRMVNYYAACLLSKGPCPPEGVEFKRILPEALQTNCLRCTEKQKTVTLRTIKRLKKEYPKIWAQLQNEWDPDGTFTAKFEATFGNGRSETIPEAPVQIFNRFGDPDEGDSSNDITNNISTTTTVAITTETSTVPTKKVEKPSSSTKKVIASTESVQSVTKIITNKPTVTNTITNTYSSPQFRPLANIGAGIEATVSLGTNIVGNLVRGIGALGDRVIETGAEIAGVVLKSIARPL